MRGYASLIILICVYVLSYRYMCCVYIHMTLCFYNLLKFHKIRLLFQKVILFYRKKSRFMAKGNCKNEISQKDLLYLFIAQLGGIYIILIEIYPSLLQREQNSREKYDITLKW